MAKVVHAIKLFVNGVEMCFMQEHLKQNIVVIAAPMILK
jgi:hypothetical protein